VGHIVPKKGDNSQDSTPLTLDLAAGILQTGSSPEDLPLGRRNNKRPDTSFSAEQTLTFHSLHYEN
jgi:hypothetical protein